MMRSLDIFRRLAFRAGPSRLTVKASMASKASDWETARYLKFENERTRPARDLLAQVTLQSPSRIVDLGCGPANSTELLAARYPSAHLTGMDSSPSMIEKARTVLPHATFELGDLKTYTPSDPVDLFYSNAAFQWLPESERVPAIQRLLSHQPVGGVFAIQVPDNWQEPSHAAMRETARVPFFEGIYSGLSTGSSTATQDRLIGNDAFPAPAELYNSLKPLCRSVDIWHTIYYHRLENHEAIVEWLRSTGLRPFLEPLNENQRNKFLKSYLEKIKKAYPVLVDGGVLLRFPRLFVVLSK